MYPLVSIIIPCYNDAQYIGQSVKSALNQTYPNKEVIVIDDGSNQETKAVLKEIEPTITKLITQENKGQSYARNIGAKSANGDYLLMLDSDDFFEPTFCEKAIEVLNSNDSIKIVTCWANLWLPDGEKKLYKPKGGVLEEFLIANNALGTSMLRNEDFKLCGGYDENMKNGFEDWELFIRILKHGGEVKVLEAPLYNYRKRFDTTTFRANEIKYDLLKYIYCKHDSLFKNHFQLFINHLLARIEHEEKEKLKRTTLLEYKLGHLILRPFRFVKSIFK